MCVIHVLYGYYNAHIVILRGSMRAFSSKVLIITFVRNAARRWWIGIYDEGREVGRLERVCDLTLYGE